MLTMLKVRMSIIVDAEQEKTRLHKKCPFEIFIWYFCFLRVLSWPLFLFNALRFRSIIECVILSLQNWQNYLEKYHCLVKKMSNFINLSLGCFSSDHIVSKMVNNWMDFCRILALLMPLSECLSEMPMPKRKRMNGPERAYVKQIYMQWWKRNSKIRHCSAINKWTCCSLFIYNNNLWNVFNLNKNDWPHECGNLFSFQTNRKHCWTFYSGKA